MADEIAPRSTFEVLERFDDYFKQLGRIESEIQEKVRHAIQMEIGSLRGQIESNLRGIQADHDNLIRLQTTTEIVLGKVDALSHDIDGKHRDNLAVQERLERRVRDLEDAKWKQTGMMTVIAFVIPLAISLAVRFWH